MKKRNKTNTFQNKQEGTKEPELNTTPSKPNNKIRLENEYSPIFIPNTQEAAAEIDVVWDWNSPQTKTKVLRKPIRSTLTQSPKLPIKRQHSNTQIQSINKLKEELDALRDEISNTNDIHESNATRLPKCKYSIDFKENKIEDEIKEIFEDDSIEEQLLLCSQEVEKTFNLEHQQKQLPTCDKTETKEKHNFNVPKIENFDDSFDVVLETFREEDFDLLTQAGAINTTHTKTNIVMMNKEEIKPNLKQPIGNDVSCTILPESNFDVEMKTILDEGSPIKCSPEEIELKRQQAKAKLKIRLEIAEENYKRQRAQKLLKNKREQLVQEKHSIFFVKKKGNFS